MENKVGELERSVAVKVAWTSYWRLQEYCWKVLIQDQIIYLSSSVLHSFTNWYSISSNYLIMSIILRFQKPADSCFIPNPLPFFRIPRKLPTRSWWPASINWKVMCRASGQDPKRSRWGAQQMLRCPSFRLFGGQVWIRGLTARTIRGHGTDLPSVTLNGDNRL